MYQLISLSSVPELAKHGYNNVHLFVPKTNQVLLLKSIRDNKNPFELKWPTEHVSPPAQTPKSEIS
jgi:hypothetical protein